MEIELTRIFIKVVQLGSLTKAADLLKTPKSTVSKALSRLENETGTKLLVRTTRSLTLTAAGRAFFESSLGPLTQLEEAQKSLYGQDSLLTGSIRITAPEDLGTFVVAPAIAELAQKHSQLKFELIYTDEILDLVRDGYDLAVRVGAAKDSNLKIKKAGEIVLIAVASPKYLKNKAKIKTPQDLKDHVCLSMDLKSTAKQWVLKSEKSTQTISVNTQITSNQMTSLLQMALAGAGVALIPSYLAKESIETGRLISVLPGWRSPGIPVSIVTPLAPSSSARLRMAVDQVYQGLSSAL